MAMCQTSAPAPYYQRHLREHNQMITKKHKKYEDWYEEWYDESNGTTLDVPKGVRYEAKLGQQINRVLNGKLFPPYLMVERQPKHGATQPNQSISGMTLAQLDWIETFKRTFRNKIQILLFFGMARLLKLWSVALRIKAMKDINGPSYPFQFKKKRRKLYPREQKSTESL
uniref:Uncharacterized protein n=1 Tax=Glossina austeni TaxID=7395 RepID=A0A1A9VL40_GLOAU